ncbi:hypothetical protein EVAR_67563_1 [Eumeta japonica]|uniref:Uncharacterized protein n=1 Tax=Eumeta variegata TaxID=151549 RepID=A0A4C1ZJ10_EUMVA|nr:hypothetical protein EVAR_67563_1 [Eumeta japonica]
MRSGAGGRGRGRGRQEAIMSLLSYYFNIPQSVSSYNFLNNSANVLQTGVFLKEPTAELYLDQGIGPLVLGAWPVRARPLTADITNVLPRSKSMM